MLELREATVTYGRITALHRLSLKVDAQQVVTIIGANGAGKSTTLRAISGLARLSSGEIRLDGERIDKLPADAIVARGIAHVPEGRRVFPDMTVAENLMTGAFLRRRGPEVNADFERALELFPRLGERLQQMARTLSGGEQQMLAIGRALMARPAMLLLDEPSMGLAPVIVDEIAKIIRSISQSGVPVVLVEQNAEMALSLADYAFVLERGRLSLEGKAESLRNNERVKAAYLGV